MVSSLSEKYKRSYIIEQLSKLKVYKNSSGQDIGDLEYRELVRLLAIGRTLNE